MSRKTIALDFDDVLFPFTHEFLIYCAEKFQVNIQNDDLRKYTFEELLGRTETEISELMDDFIYSEKHSMLPLINGAKEALHSLQNTYDFVVISARPKNQEKLVRTWLQKNLNIEIKEFYLVDHFKEGATPTIKADIAKELGVSYFIEDSLSNSLQIAEIGIPVFLITREWNESQGIQSELITRVPAWHGIAEAISRREILEGEKLKDQSIPKIS